MEERGEDARAYGQSVDFGVVEIEDDDEQRVDEVESEEDAGEDPGGAAREEKRVAAAGVVEQEAQRFFERGCRRGDLPQGPDGEAQEARVECVSGKGQERHYQHGPCCVAEGDHAVWCEGETEVIHHGL